MVEHPERNDDYLSNAPIPAPSDNVNEPKSGSIHFSVDHSTIPPDNPDRSSKWGKGRPRKINLSIKSARQIDPNHKCGSGHPRKSEVTTSKSKPPEKRGRGRPPKSNTSQPVISETVCTSDNNQECSNRGIERASGERDDGQPPLKISKQNTLSNSPSVTISISHNNQEGSNKGIKRTIGNRDDGQPPLKVSKQDAPSYCPSVSTTFNTSCAQFQQTVQLLLCDRSPQSVLLSMLSLNSVEGIITALNGMGVAIESISQALNALPIVFADNYRSMPLATSIANQCHPLILHTYKPIVTTGDGDCMYHALSRAVCGSEQLSKVFRLLIAYSIVKYRDVMIQALQDAFPLQSHG